MSKQTKTVSLNVTVTARNSLTRATAALSQLAGAFQTVNNDVCPTRLRSR